MFSILFFVLKWNNKKCIWGIRIHYYPVEINSICLDMFKKKNWWTGFLEMAVSIQKQANLEMSKGAHPCMELFMVNLEFFYLFHSTQLSSLETQGPTLFKILDPRLISSHVYVNVTRQECWLWLSLSDCFVDLVISLSCLSVLFVPITCWRDWPLVWFRMTFGVI